MKPIATTSVLLLFSNINLVFGEDSYSYTSCSDACGSSSTDCLELVDDNLVVGCYGTWYGGPISSDALNLCNAYGGGWHLCESANEAEILGLTTNICENDVPIGHSFWTLESSLVDAEQDGQCFSKYGYASCCNRPRNDIWGCVNAETSIPGCGPLEDTPCGVLNINCGDYQGADFGDSGLQLCDGSCDDTELFIMHALDSSKNGVLCCRDTIPDSNPNTQCDESITVWSLRQGFNQPLPNFAPYIGKYEYYGNNNENGYPRYVHEESGAEITVSNFMTADLVLKLILPNYGTFFSPAISFESGVITNAGNGRFEIINNYFSRWGTDTSMSTSNNDHLEWIARGTSTLQMTATFNDCQYYGLELVSSPTVPTPKPTNYPTQPTPQPSDPTPKPSNSPSAPTTPLPTIQGNTDGCPNYDRTTYENGECEQKDPNCESCQSWGCAKCKDGYYKMGNTMKCQSCSDNYNNCNLCNDWNGCTTCKDGYTLTWNPYCTPSGDELCQLMQY